MAPFRAGVVGTLGPPAWSALQKSSLLPGIQSYNNRELSGQNDIKASLETRRAFLDPSPGTAGRLQRNWVLNHSQDFNV